jgi:hypothetical protein
MEGQATFVSPDADGTLQEVVARTVEVIERQLALIGERAPGEYLDKRPVVQSLQAHVRRLRAALAAPSLPAGDGLTVADYQAAFEDHQRMVRELDVLLNGDAAAKQASLCDIVAQVRKEGIRSHGVALTEQQAKNLHSHMMAVACRTWDQAEPTSVKARLRAVMKALAAEPKIRADLSAAPRRPGEMGAGVQGAGMQCDCDQPTNVVHELDCPAAPRQAFEAAYSHLDLTKQIDSWRGLVYKHSHVDAMWEAWQRAASAQQEMGAGVPASDTHVLIPRSMLSAAVCAIENGQKAPETVAAMRDAYLANPNQSQPASDERAGEANFDDYVVEQFAVAMKRKLADARAKGRSGWQYCTEGDLSRMLREHVDKGDPRDVANFCMFLWYHGAAIGTGTAKLGEWLGAPTASAQQDEREAFEVWAVGTGLDVLRAAQWANTDYQSLPTEDAWRGWKARGQQVQADAGAVAWIAEHENDELDFVNFHEEVARQQAEESGALRVRPLVYGDANSRPVAESDRRGGLTEFEERIKAAIEAVEDQDNHAALAILRTMLAQHLSDNTETRQQDDRAAFEVIAKEQCLPLSRVGITYDDISTQAAWAVYRKARAAMFREQSGGDRG